MEAQSIAIPSCLHTKRKDPASTRNGVFTIKYEVRLNHRLDGAGDLAGAEAPCTHIDMAGSTIHKSLYAANVWLPSSIRTSVGM